MCGKGRCETLSDSEKWLEAASSGLGAPVPAQVADKLREKSFRNGIIEVKCIQIRPLICPDAER